MPPPSFDPASYKPFDEEINRTIDQILSEEGACEKTRDEDWPCYSGGDSSGGSSGGPTPHTDKSDKKSPYFSEATSVNGRMTRGRQKRVARRDITVVNLESDSDEDIFSHGVNGPETGDSGLGDQAGHGDQDPLSHGVDYQEPKDLDPESQAAIDDESPLSQRVVDQEPQGPTPGDHPRINDDHTNGESNETTGQDIGDNPAVAEEDIIFASVEPSQRDHLLHYLVSHTFMANRVQPVQRFARRQFVDEMRKEAESAGMGEMAIDRLIEYVRKIYLEVVEVQVEPLVGDLKDVPFGEEIIDEHMENAHHEKSRKRILDHAEQRQSKKIKRSKESKRSSVEGTEPSPRSALLNEPSIGGQSVKPPLEEHPPAQEPEVPSKNLSSLGNLIDDVEKGHDEPRGAVLPTTKHESTTALEAHESRGNTIEPEPVLPNQASGEKDSSRNQRHHESLQGAVMNVLSKSPPSEPELPPPNELLIRPSKVRRSKHLQERSHERNRDIVIDITNSPPPDPAPEPEPVNEPRVRSSTAEEIVRDSDRNQEQRRQATSRKQHEINVTIHDRPDESSNNLAQKHLNWRKKEKKKRKKRKSHLERQIEAATVQNFSAHQTPLKSQSPASTPNSRVSNRSKGKSNGALSPDPAQWDVDF